MSRSVAGTAVCALALLLVAAPAHATSPGANGRISFETNRTAGISEVWTANPDGSGAARLTAGYNASWSPDGKKVAFAAGAAQTDIYVMSAAGGAATQVTTNAANDFAPVWSPDGQKLAFQSDRDGNYEIYAVKVDGTGETNLTNNAAIDQGPDWSPDGSKIAFISTRSGGEHEIFLINTNGSGVTNLTNNTSFSDVDPSWSPDGKKIAFTSFQAGNLEIYTMNADGSGRTRLTNNIDFDDQPAWSPDAKKIAFASYVGAGNTEIVTINADGSGPANVTNDPATDSYPRWQPVGALDRYPRPGGGSPFRIQLVPAFRPCTAPNSSHVLPLAGGSCTPPQTESSMLTVATTGSANGVVRFDTVVGDPATGADEADLNISFVLSGPIYRTVGGGEYTGKIALQTKLRLTDRASGYGGVSATMQDYPFGVPVDCGPVPGNPSTFACLLTTSADALVPGMVVESRRTVASVMSLTVEDPGNDNALGAQCPPSCGTGDEQRLFDEGAFVP